jgi:hypothetical protein
MAEVLQRQDAVPTLASSYANKVHANDGRRPQLLPRSMSAVTPSGSEQLHDKVRDPPMRANSARWSEQHAGVKILRHASSEQRQRAGLDEAVRRLRYGSPAHAPASSQGTVAQAHDFGHVGGLGVCISIDDTGYPVIIDVESDGPAAKSRMLFPGDVIYAIDGKQYCRCNAQTVIDALGGVPDTTVELLLDSLETLDDGSSRRSLRRATVRRSKHTDDALHTWQQQRSAQQFSRVDKVKVHGIPSLEATHEAMRFANSRFQQPQQMRLLGNAPGCSMERNVIAAHGQAAPSQERGPPPEKVHENLESFYAVYSPTKLGKVRGLVADYLQRGGTAEEYAALNQELKARPSNPPRPLVA